MRGQIELLAPAGSAEALTAAVQSGADAVYMGGRLFSARQSNFSKEEMKQYVDYCHLYGVQVHIAVNTLIKENELHDLTAYIYELNDIGVDAVIVQDMGAVSLFRQIVPELELHGSTQMTVTDLAGVRFLENRGISRVVLARELTKEQIAYICRHANAEIEMFCHGAICMCYSGQCLMSSIIGGRSGNRGRCAQPCRLPYELMENGTSIKAGHLLSPKDLALIDELDTIKHMKVASLKIEGRLKRPEYVAAVVGVYRRYLDHSGKVEEQDRRELLHAFNRSGLTKAYFAHQTGGQMMSFENPGNVAEQIFTEDAKNRARKDANIRKIKIGINAKLQLGSVLEVCISDEDGNSVTACGSITAEAAVTRALDRERLVAQLEKLGATPFISTETQVILDDGITIPVSEINLVRRNAVGLLAEKRIARSKRVSHPFQKPDIHRTAGNIELTAEVETAEQAEAVVKHGIRRIYAPHGLTRRIKEMSDNIEVVTKLADITREDMKNDCTEADAVMLTHFSQMETYSTKRRYGDFRLNVFNSYTAEFYKNLETVTVSPELNLKEIRQLAEHTEARLEVIGYGRLTLMITQNCPIKAASGRCQNKQHMYSLKDRKNEVFPILCGKGCAARILNAKPIFMADKIEDMKKSKINCIRLIFTVENFLECDTILDVYTDALKGKNVIQPFGENEFTRGHFYRGVQ